MIIIQNFIPLLGAFLDGFGSYVTVLIALGVVFGIPKIIKEVVSYV